MNARYEDYKARIIAQGSHCYLGQHQWEAAVRRDQEGYDVVFQVTSKTAELKPGWYKNTFGPGNALELTMGPFNTQTEAEES